jgi:hypothetical protein
MKMPVLVLAVAMAPLAPLARYWLWAAPAARFRPLGAPRRHAREGAVAFRQPQVSRPQSAGDLP